MIANQPHSEPTAPTIEAVPQPQPNLLAELNAARQELAAVTAQRDQLAVHVKTLEENSFLFAFSNLDAGQVLLDAGQQMRDVCATVRKLQQKGVLTVKLTVKPFKGDALVFLPDVKAVCPTPEAPQGIFYANDDGALSRNDPRQRELPL